MSASLRVSAHQRHGRLVVVGSLLPVAQRWEIHSPGLRERIRVTNDWLEGFAADHQLLYADFYTAFDAGNGIPAAGYLTDGLHPSARGYAVMTDVLHGVMNSR